ncbi:MAG: hypothetical protein QXD11_01355 [Candidatus Micrarchaeaceae archaeon]
MAEKNTFALNRIEIKRVLASFKVPEKNILNILSTMEKAHRHINVITFIALIEKAGVSRDKISDLLRRFGMDDVMIKRSFDMFDQQKIMEETGRIYEISIS